MKNDEEENFFFMPALNPIFINPSVFLCCRSAVNNSTVRSFLLLWIVKAKSHGPSPHETNVVTFAFNAGGGFTV